MKISKFIKDLFATGLTQILVLLFAIILLRIMATALSKEYFGIFMIIRRIIAVGAPLITLNLGVGLARYVSYEREREREFLSASLWIIGVLSLSVLIISSIFRDQLSLIFFNTSNYSILVVLTAFFLFSYGVYNISYAFFRGRQEMIRANWMLVLYYFFPMIIGLILWQFFSGQDYKILSLYFFFFSLWGIVLGLIFIRRNVYFGRFTANIRDIQSVKNLLFYSLSRIPSSFFLALIFGIPIFIASHKISLIAAGYVGIMVAVVRLMVIFTAPINLLFLPKFAEIKRRNVDEEISNKVSVVTSFIFTALPLIAVVSFGLAKYVVIIFFGEKFISAIPGVSIVILFSGFYLSYVLIREILDGLFSFPYVNVISLVGLLTTTISSFLFHDSVFMLALSFALGLFVMGVTAAYILVKRTNISVQLNQMLVSLVIAFITFILLLFFDKWLEFTIFNEYTKFVGKILFRTILLLTIFWFYWKPKSLWVRELLYRIRT